MELGRNMPNPSEFEACKAGVDHKEAYDDVVAYEIPLREAASSATDGCAAFSLFAPSIFI